MAHKTNHSSRLRSLIVKLFSYVVARDYGFAPNPFFAYCTLCTCKPEIRRYAEIGDWILGTGSKSKNRESHVVFVMRVTETRTFEEYWDDSRFQAKRPTLRASIKRAFGDNIYFKVLNASSWRQLDSHHSWPDGSPNLNNVIRDTDPNRVLISDDFLYWGGEGPLLPARFRGGEGDVRHPHRGYKCHFRREVVEAFVDWVRSLEESGYLGEPLDWPRSQ